MWGFCYLRALRHLACYDVLSIVVSRFNLPGSVYYTDDYQNTMPNNNYQLLTG